MKLKHKPRETTHDEVATACRLYAGAGGVYPLYARLFADALRRDGHRLADVLSWRVTAWGWSATLRADAGTRTVYITDRE